VAAYVPAAKAAANTLVDPETDTSVLGEANPSSADANASFNLTQGDVC
jgi:hypothetical protein